MGFHKRFITKYHILENIDRIEEFLDADALILDSWSSNFVNDLNKEEEVTLVRYDKDAKQIIIGTALVKSI